MRMTYRVYRRLDGGGRKFLGIIAVRLDRGDEDRRAIEMARGLYGAGPHEHDSDLEVEIEGID